jgi:hypothetical protein
MIPFMQPSNENRLTRETTRERYCSIQGTWQRGPNYMCRYKGRITVIPTIKGEPHVCKKSVCRYAVDFDRRARPRCREIYVKF